MARLLGPPQNPEFRLGVRRRPGPEVTTTTRPGGITTTTRPGGTSRQIRGVAQLRQDLTGGPLLQGIQQQALQNLQQPSDAFATARNEQLAAQLGGVSQAQRGNVQAVEERLAAQGRGRSGLAVSQVRDLERARLSSQASLISSAGRDIATRETADQRAALQQALQTLQTLSGVAAQQRVPVGGQGAFPISQGRAGGGGGQQLPPQFPPLPPPPGGGGGGVGGGVGGLIPGLPPGTTAAREAGLEQTGLLPPVGGQGAAGGFGPLDFPGVGSVPQFGAPGVAAGGFQQPLDVGGGVGGVPGAPPPITATDFQSIFGPGAFDQAQSIWG